MGLPCLLTIPASLVLWVLAPGLEISRPLIRALTLVPALVAFLILIYAFSARRRSWVQCREKSLKIQTPFYPLVVSYARVKGVRPTAFNQVFDPRTVKGAIRSWLRPYWGRTAVVVELSKLPVNERWLRMWFSPYLLVPQYTGFVFVVEDWMALSQQVDDFRKAWDMERSSRRQYGIGMETF